MSEENGSEVVPILGLTWNAESQDTNVAILDRSQVKNWEFALALLEMGKRKVEKMIRIFDMQHMQQAATEHKRTEQLRRNLHLGS